MTQLVPAPISLLLAQPIRTHCCAVLSSDLNGIHDDGGDEVKEDVVAVGACVCVAEGHLQLVHGLQEQTLTFVLKVLERCLLNTHTHTRAQSRLRFPQQISN